MTNLFFGVSYLRRGGSDTQEPFGPLIITQEHGPEQCTVALRIPRQTPISLGFVASWLTVNAPEERTVSKVAAKIALRIIKHSFLRIWVAGPKLTQAQRFQVR